MKRQHIHLGYSVPDGKPVEIPLNHMVITGQTQMAGKTSTCEALIGRADLQALTFITKRGEGSFKGARQIAPYFQEAADWKFIRSLLEASQQTKMKFESPWIIRSSKGAKTLADVQRNVRKLMENAKGINADMYLMLDAYLDILVPQIDKVKWAKNVDLAPGISVMDLTNLKTEMQQLVIKSTLDWVMAFAQNTVVVIPEAWAFIPEGRGTPVKLSAESYIRQGGGLRNFLWIDSQDLVGVEKLILKSCPVWLLGVQREANEIKHVLNNIPADIKRPKASQIAHLGLGEFYACWEKSTVKTYVQPLWLNNLDAMTVAKGNMTAEEVGERVLASEFQDTMSGPVVFAPEGIPVWLEEPIGADAPIIEEEDEMSAEGEKAIIEGLDRINSKLDTILREDVVATAPVDWNKEGPGTNGGHDYAPAAVADLYEDIKQRLIKDAPFLIKLYTLKPEIVVEDKRVVLEAGNDLQGHLLRLISEGFFDEGTNANQAFVELKRRGKAPATNIPVYKAMDALTELGAVTKEYSGKNVKYAKAPGLKVTKK